MPIASTFTQYEELGFYQTEVNQSHYIGQLAMSLDGKLFRYVKAGASNLVKGNLLQSPARDTNFTDMAVQAAVATTVAINPTFQGYPIPVTLGGTATTSLTQFQGGTLSVTVTPGLGQTFTILGNDIQATTNGTCNFYVLEQPLTALTTSSKVTATLNPYNGVIQSPTTVTGKIVGVANVAIPASNFGWIQSHGECSVLSDASVATIGQGIARSTTTAGAVTVMLATANCIGQAVVLGVSAEAQPVDLKID